MNFLGFLIRNYECIKGRYAFGLGLIYILGMLMKFVYGQVKQSNKIIQ